MEGRGRRPSLAVVWLMVAFAAARPEKATITAIKGWIQKTVDEQLLVSTTSPMSFCHGYEPKAVRLMVSDLTSSESQEDESSQTTSLSSASISKLCADPSGYVLKYPIKLNYLTDPGGTLHGNFYAGLRLKQESAERWTPDPDKQRCDGERGCCVHLLEPVKGMTLPSKTYLRAAHGVEVNDWVYKDVLVSAEEEESDQTSDTTIRVGACVEVHYTTSGKQTVDVLEAFLFDPADVTPENCPGIWSGEKCNG